jgi:putative modified peptide
MTDIQKLAALFDKLGNDDAFRARLEADPAAALAELGVQVPAGLPAHVTLPSKEAVRANAPAWLASAEDASTAMAVFFFLK